MGDVIKLNVPKVPLRDRATCWLRGHVWKLSEYHRESCLGEENESSTIYRCQRCTCRMAVWTGAFGVQVSYPRRVHKIKAPWTTKGWRYQWLRLRAWIKTTKAERELIRRCAAEIDKEIIEALKNG